jgi:hypothetical protein
MPVNRAGIAKWFAEGVDQDATHMIVVCDQFDYEDYPVYVKPGQDVHKKVTEYLALPMQKIMEVYDLRKPMMEQVYSADRVFNY